MIINLTENFQPFGAGNPNIKFKSFDFPSGSEPHIKFSKESIFYDEPILITTRIQSLSDYWRLILATDAIRRLNGNIGSTFVNVFISYLPFARQDKVMEEGEPLSLRVIADHINSIKYDKVLLFDVHSPTALALIDRSRSISNHAFVEEVLKDKKDYMIVSPDNGASKKIYPLCKALNYTGEIVQGEKLRNISTGEVIDVTISHPDLQGKDCYIIDDICDGGKTFIVLAEKLKKANAGKINLIVSHGIFSKGLKVFDGIEHIYTTDSFCDFINPKRILPYENHLYLHKLTQIKLNPHILR